MQIAYISNRPEVARDSLRAVAALMPFVESAVVVCPAAQAERFRRPAGRLALTAVAEEELLGELRSGFARSHDHQAKNWLLRASLPRLAALGEVYLMADDDSRPLREIPRTTFVEDGRYHAFFTHDLARWRARETDYDAGQHVTREVLAGRGYPTLCYSAHMPQVVDKALYAGVVRELDEEISRGLPLDEWSVYFNVARSRHPERFHPPRPYETLCWPALPTDWETGARPAAASFENFDPTLYGPGGLFEGIPPGFDPAAHPRHAAEKIRRREAVQRVYDSLPARLLRRGAWLLHRAAVGAGERGWRGAGPIRRGLLAAERRGHDPAWSFPGFLTRYSCRRTPPAARRPLRAPRNDR